MHDGFVHYGFLVYKWQGSEYSQHNYICIYTSHTHVHVHFQCGMYDIHVQCLSRFRNVKWSMSNNLAGIVHIWCMGAINQQQHMQS